MAIVRDSYNIPDDMIKKISTGENKRHGGVIRNNQGQIVQLLKPISKKEAILRYAWNNRDTLINVGKVGVQLSRTYLKSKKKSELDVVSDFRDSLKIYQDALHKDALTLKVISDLMDRLDEMKNHANSEKIVIALSLEELDTLLNQIFEYTRELAAEKAIQLAGLQKEFSSQSENPIYNLRLCLETQKRILELAS